MKRLHLRYCCRRLSRVILLAGIVSFSVPAHGLYRGDEMTLRDFSVGSLYFINRATYLPLIEHEDRFRTATNALLGAAGSLGSDDLYLFQRLDVQYSPNQHITLNADYLRDRDFDGNYQRFTMGLEWHMTPAWSLQLLGSPTPNKEDALIGTELRYRHGRIDTTAGLHFPLFNFEKNPDDATLNRQPINVQWQGRFRLGARWEIYGQTDVDFPSRMTNPEQGFDFEFEKYQAAAGLRFNISTQTHVRIETAYENSTQERAGRSPDDELDFTLDREFAAAHIEFYHVRPDRSFVRMGGHFVYFNEDNDFPNDAEETLLLDRQDRILYAGRSFALRDGLQLSAVTLVNFLSDRRESEDDRVARDRDIFIVRAAGSIIFYGPRYVFECGAAVRLDRTRFGGGFVRVFMDF